MLNPRLFGSSLNDIMQVALIADGAYGVVTNYEDDVHDDWGTLSGAGFLFKFSWQEAFTSQVSVAWPTMAKSSIEGTGDDPDDPTVYADISFFF
ncbi:hypothetical protein [Microbulbifer taiwanensis]|uniref:hypothetical protein n=1 Tax=Microbulbifer taiwanensis TaxID=986746 RepID=UPI00361C05D4